MDVSMDQIKALREETGVSIMQCKKALEEANGDVEAARVILRKRAGAAAEKKADRDLGAGCVASYIHDGAIGAMVLLSCETDFVAKNEEFIALAKDVAMQVAATSPKYISVQDISEEEKAKAREVFQSEVEGKPLELKEQILEGKLKSYFKDMVLLEQPFIKDSDKTIATLIQSAVQKFGERTEVTQVARFSVR
jgi:elongation factor Ts